MSTFSIWLDRLETQQVGWGKICAQMVASQIASCFTRCYCSHGRCSDRQHDECDHKKLIEFSCELMKFGASLTITNQTYNAYLSDVCLHFPGGDSFEGFIKVWKWYGGNFETKELNQLLMQIEKPMQVISGKLHYITPINLENPVKLIDDKLYYIAPVEL